MFFFPQCWFTGASGVSNWQSSDGILIGTLFMKLFFFSNQGLSLFFPVKLQWQVNPIH
jgi:hypothetical protein